MWSFPRYWMVAGVGVLMCTVLLVEYARVRSYHPSVYTGILNYSPATRYPASRRNLSALANFDFHSRLTQHRPEVTLIPINRSTYYSLHSKVHITTEEVQSLEVADGKIFIQNHTVYTVNRKSHELGLHKKKYSKKQKLYHKRSTPKHSNRSSVAVKFTEKERRWHKMQQFHARHRGVGISGGLLKLVGLQLSSYSDLHGRGFSEWHNTTVTLSHLPTLQKAVQMVDLDVASPDRFISMSMNPDIIARGHFQKEQMKRFCAESGQRISFLPSTPEALTTLFTHLLYDDSKRIVFCYVPKNGCSNMKRLLLILNGLLPPESAQQNRPSETVLKKVKSFRNLTAEEAIFKIKNYYKFAIVRNPLERLLSAYRNKLEHPVVYEERKHFPSSLQLFIMSLFRPNQVKLWLESMPEKRHSIFPSFKEFVTYMKMFPLGDYNEHFAPFSELCHPCSIAYDFYANFKIMDYDISAILEYLSIPSSYYPTSPGSNQNTTGLMTEYYRLLSLRDKRALFSAFQTELSMYYSLYPEEINMHHQFLTV